MANIRDVAEGEEERWIDWAKDRPQVIRDLAARFRPWKLYRLTTTNQRVVLYSFSEDNTVTVAVLGLYNLVTMERRVFGINPDDLVECDLPGDGEMLGSLLKPGSPEELDYINLRRAELGNPPLTREQAKQMEQGGDMDP